MPRPRGIKAARLARGAGIACLPRTGTHRKRGRQPFDFRREVRNYDIRAFFCGGMQESARLLRLNGEGEWEMYPKEEKDAFIEALYTRFYGTLRCLCMRYVGYDPRYLDAVEDCVQEAFLTAYQHYEELIAHPNVGGWLTRTCMFRMGTIIRGRKRDAMRTRNLDDVTCADPRDGVAEWVDRAGAAVAARSLLTALSETDRALAQERYVQGRSMAEIAKARGISESGAKVALFRVRRRARSFAEKHPEIFTMCVTFLALLLL